MTTPDCQKCNLVRIAGSVAGVLTVGALLFFSCGKPEDKKTDTGTGGDAEGDVEIHLTFEAYADETVDTFRVYAGKSKDKLKEATELSTEGSDFDHAKPEIVVESAGNSVLGALLGGQGCFQLRAVKDDVESDGSNVVCTDL